VRALSVFADESAVRERYMAFGGIFIASEDIDAAEEFLQDFAERRGFADREISWKNCSKGEVQRYCRFAELLWSLDEGLPRVDFRALVVDTRKTPLRSPDHRCPTEEDGFYRFYHHFLTASVRLVSRRTPAVHLFIAETTDRYPYRTEILTSTVGGALKRRLGSPFEIGETQRRSPRDFRLHQLADVLVGAVTYRWNEGTRPATKAPICECIEKRVGRRLDTDFKPQVRPFNVWTFTPIGKERWAAGGTGVV
jgi:hypothetical protein